MNRVVIEHNIDDTIIVRAERTADRTRPVAAVALRRTHQLNSASLQKTAWEYFGLVFFNLRLTEELP